jgi:preprotein translocase subunit SecG
MHTVVIVIHLMVVTAMIGFVLLQKSEGGGLGMGGGSGGFMSSRGTANVLTRSTAVLAGAFFVTSLLLSWLASYERKPSTILQTPAGPSAPGPTSPLGSGGGGVLNQLRGPPATPAAPSGPQVPQSQ